MPLLPLDVYYWVYKEFSFKDAVTFVKKLEDRVAGGYSYVDQYTRAIVFFSDGSLAKFNELFAVDDPRDIITWENRNPGNFEHWFSIRLDQIEDFHNGIQLYFEHEALLENSKSEAYWRAIEQEDASRLKSFFDSIKGDWDIGYSSSDLLEIFGNGVQELPEAYLEFLRTMGSRNRIFAGEHHDPRHLESYMAGYLSALFIDEVFEKQKAFVAQFVVFLSSQGCNWLMFKKEDTSDPAVYFANEIDLSPKIYYHSFTEMIKQLKKMIEG